MQAMKSPLSPLDIEVLLHYATAGTPHPRHYCFAVEESTDMWVKCAVLMPAPVTSGMPVTHQYVATSKGRAIVSMLCNIKEPTQVWVDEHGKPIKDNQ